MEQSTESDFAGIVTNERVLHMEEDRYRPGHIIYADQYALKTSDGTNTSIVAGSPTENNYREAVGIDSRFEIIRGFAQVADGRIIVADTGNNCLRQVNRTSSVTSVFSGPCKASRYRGMSEVPLNSPWSVIVDNQNSSLLLFTDHYNHVVKSVEISTGVVSNFSRQEKNHEPKYYVVTYMAQDTNGDIFITGYRAIYRIAYDQRTIQHISGSLRHSGYRDSTLLNSLYDRITDLAFIGPGTFLVIEERLRLVHTNSNRVTTVDRRVSYEFLWRCKWGSMCRRHPHPESLLVTNDSLYVGWLGRIKRYKCELQS